MSERYFKIETGKILKEAMAIVAGKKAMREAYKSLTSEIGANASYYQEEGELVAFIFDKVDRVLFRKVAKTNGYMPKKNTKFGKEIWKKLEAVKVVKDEDLLDGLGIQKMLFDIPYMRYSVVMILPYESPIVLIKMPWKSISPKKLDAYKKDESVSDVTLDFLCFEPSLEMIEIEEYELKEIIEQYNSSLKDDGDKP